jgi:transcriptional regulator with XRE-family HTH domain
MVWNEKLAMYLKTKGISQKEAGKRLDTSTSMMSRYLTGKDKVNSDFIIKLLKVFPDIDLRSIFSDEPPNLKENDFYDPPREINVINELEIIEKKITLIKEYLAQKSHKEK